MNINIQDGPDLAILSDTHGIVRGIENILSTNYPNLPIITTSENQSQYSTILSRYEDENDPRFKRDIDQLRRTKKVHFTIDTNAIKISTIKSYKGLEAENIIVIVEPNCEPATLYTGLTRAKNNLIIISLCNPQYDAFFSSEDNVYINTGLGCGSIKKSKIVKFIMDDYENIHFIKEDGSLDKTTCPVRNTARIYKFLNKKVNFEKKNVLDNVCFFPKEYFCPLDYNTRTMNLTDNTFAIHWFNGSWMSKIDKLKYYIKRFLKIKK